MRSGVSAEISAAATATGADLDLLRETVRRLVRKFDRDYIRACMKSKREPAELWAELCATGLIGSSVPEVYGGGGASLREVITIGEELTRAGIPLLTFVMTELCLPVLAAQASEELRRRVIPPIVRGERRLAFAITEPDAGTNAFAMTTTAVRDGDVYRINGRKRWISSADVADDLLLICRIPSWANGAAASRRGISALIVDMASPGIELIELTADAGTPELQFEVVFTDVEVPRTNLVGAESDGTSVMFSALNAERVIVASYSYGLGFHAIDRAVSYANERSPFGEPIGGYQAIQHPLASAWAELTAARALNFQAVDAIAAGEPSAAGLANAAKWLASEASNRAADHAIQVHGGNGITEEYDLLWLWRATRLMRFAPISNEMVLNYISQHVLGLPRSYGVKLGPDGPRG
jgi:acyl-CoA dehydrogenase